MTDLEKRIAKLTKRVDEVERQLHSHRHLPNLPLVVRGIPTGKGQVLIPSVRG